MNAYSGTLPGSLSVDNSGGAAYSIDIDIPPGTAGMAPKLSFAYSSLGANGPLGVGWALSGLSVIERSASTLAQDGMLAGITFSNTDRLTLDGSRLVPRRGSSYFGTDTIYETEIQSWHKVIPIYSGTPNRQGPDAFEVHQRNGRIYRYGMTPDAQGVISSDNPSIRAWYLSSISDRCGNTITFSYVDAGAGGYRLPSVINYTSNSSFAARRSVGFQYEQRTDIESGYVAGFPFQIAQRLKNVATMVDKDVISSYSLAYEYGAATGRSRIVSITRADGTGVALPPTTFAWQEAIANFGAATALGASAIQWGGTFLPMDVDGDGRVDFVNAYNGPTGDLRMTIFLAQDDGTFADPIAVPPSGLAYGGQFVTLDANGDGKMEIAYAVDNAGMLGITLFVSALVDGAWTFVPGVLNGAGPSDIKSGGSLVSADVDGDGLADLVLIFQASGGTLGLKTLFSDGVQFAPSPTDKTAPTISFGGNTLACDVNADGMDDLIYTTLTGGGSELALTAFKSLGRDGFVQVDNVLVGTVPAGGQPIPIDVNADGNTDLVLVASDQSGNMVATVLLNDGLLFHAGNPVATGLPSGGLVVPASLTASSSPEILALTHDAHNQVVLTAFRTSASGLTPIPGIAQPPSGTLAGGNAMPLDMRGVGFSDLVYAVNARGSQTAFVMPAAGPYPDLLVTASNGIGGRYTATYTSMTDATVYSSTVPANGGMEPRALLHGLVSGASFGNGYTPSPVSVGARHVLQRTPIPKYLVKSTTKQDGIGTTWTSNHRYEDALIDRSGRGWLGFAAVETDDLDIGTTTRVELLQAFPLTQMISASVVTRTADKALMTDAEYGFEVPQSGSSYQVLATSNSTASYSFAAPGSTPDTILASSTQYDAFGNVVQAATYGSALAAGSSIVQSYEIDEDNWQLGLLSERTELAGADSDLVKVLRLDQFSYDANNWMVLKHSRWDDANSQWLDSGFSYDAFGNTLTTTDLAGGVTTRTYETGFNTFVATESVNASVGSLPIVQSFDVEPAFGSLSKSVDVAGAVEQRLIDGLGRTISVSRTAPSGSVTEISRTAWTTENDLLCVTTSRRLDWVSDIWTATRTYSDGLGRSVRTERDPAVGTNPITVDVRYNSIGSRLSQTLPRFAGDPIIAATWKYDAFSRVTQADTPAADGSMMTTENAYPTADTVVTTLAAGTSSAQTTTVRFAVTDGGHVPASRTDNLGAVTTYQYDGLGHLMTLTDPSGIRTGAEYDSLGRQTRTWVAQDGKTLSSRSIEYMDATRSMTETTANSSLTLVKDALQRVIEKRTGTGDVTKFVYDEPDMPFAVGRLTTATLPNGDALRYGYDPDGNVSLRKVTVAGVESVLTQTFLPGGKRASTSFPDGSLQANAYGANGNLSGVAFTPAGARARNLFGYSGFDANDNPAQIALANGVSSSVGYDVYGRLASNLVADPHGARVFDYHVSRGPTDAITSLGDPSTPQVFAYDPVGRLASTSGGVANSQSYSYDPSGNCVGASGTTFAYEGYSAISGVGEDAFSASYDADGALTGLARDGVSTSYIYDAEQRLVSGTIPATGAAASYTYDPSGTRLTKTEDGIVTIYVGPDYEIVRFPDGSIQHSCVVGERGTRDYAYTAVDHGSPPVTDGIPEPGEAYFVCDQLRSTRLVLDGNGAVTATVDYDPFGAVANVTGSAAFRYGFSGREYDRLIGAYYFGARYFDPRLRRFLTPDDQMGGSLLDRDTFNIYAYVMNDPVALIDRTGHSWWDFVGQVLVDVAMVAAGIALIAVTGGTANIVGSGLIGAGIGGLSYDIKQAATGKGADANWGKWGIQVGIGAATGLLTGGVAVGASSALAAQGVEGLAKGLAMAGIMAVTASASAMASTVANNAISGSSLTSGLGMAGVSGAVVGMLGGGLSTATSQIMGSGIEAAEVAAPGAEIEENVANDAAADAENAADPVAQQPPPRPSFTTRFMNAYNKPTSAWAAVRNSSPRLIFGSLRSVLNASMPGFATLF